MVFVQVFPERSERVSCHKARVRSYADDTAFIASGNSLGAVEEALQRQLRETCEWLIDWIIRVNVEKFAQLTFALR